eukprot:GEMP01041843.1.p1 GENE.GEMP01041843.1~~GEMP01041843.1.p1  ORF type:complete len:118 (+),score=41.22 GEMP01041843.1:38-391(+)
MADLLKKLKIKMGAVERTKKEYELYVLEEVDQREKIKKMEAAQECSSVIKQQQEVLNDTLQVLPDSRERLAKFASELQKFLNESVPKDLDLTNDGDIEKLVLESQELLKQSAELAPA